MYLDRRILKSNIRTKVLMLSATPVNNKMNDLKNQLCLIVKKPTAQTAHLVFANTQAKVQKTKRAVFCQRLTE